MPLGKYRILAIRNKLGVTQARFAQLLGVHPLTVSKWERGELQPTKHHEELMKSFEIAGAKDSEIGETVTALLITAGVAFALLAILDAAHGSKK